ncbi:MAG: hypothetical protein WEC59_11690 [Salibacteraceae bacterium]
MVIPVGEVNGVQRMITIDKRSENDFEIKEHGDFKFVPMLEKTDTAE